MDFIADETSVTGTVPLGPDPNAMKLHFRATNFRVERGQRKATITVLMDDLTAPSGLAVLDEDDISLAKREERTRLMNSAHKALVSGSWYTSYSVNQAQSDFLTFTRTAWNRWMDTSTYTETTGTEKQHVPWLLLPFAIENSGTILFAPPGSGKSFLALSIAIAVDAGGSTLWRPDRQANTLYINLERSRQSFERRIGSLNVALGHPRERSLKMIHSRGRSLTDVSDSVRRIIERENIELVILDSLSRAGQSLVDDTAANRTIDILNSWMPVSWLCIGHTPRNDSGHVFGSQMFSAGCDLEVGVQSTEQAGTITAQGEIGPGTLWQKLTVVKSNDVGKPPPQALKWSMSKFGVDRIDHAPISAYPSDETPRSNTHFADLTANHYQIISRAGEGIGLSEFVDSSGCGTHRISDETVADRWIKVMKYVDDACHGMDQGERENELEVQLEALKMCDCCLGPSREVKCTQCIGLVEKGANIIR